jgi:PiT family inorganic phosphate transporter
MIQEPMSPHTLDYPTGIRPEAIPHSTFHLDGYRNPLLKWLPPVGIATLIGSVGYYAYQSVLNASNLQVPPLQAILLGCAVGAVLLYEYFNGSHDAANSTAAIIKTKVLTPEQAGVLFAIMNTLGAVTNTAVAKTIGHDIIGEAGLPLEALIGALIGGIGWSALTLRLGRPTSSSHTLLSSLIGAAIAVHGVGSIQWHHVASKIAIPMVVAIPVALLLSAALAVLFKGALSGFQETSFSKSKIIQIATSCWLAFSHGSNDGQKGMGMIALGLGALGALSGHDLPAWVLYSCAIAMGLGTLAGGREVVAKLSKLFDEGANPRDGANAQGAAAAIINLATVCGIPLSTTQVTSMSNMGTSLGKLVEFHPMTLKLQESNAKTRISRLFGCEFVEHLGGLKKHVNDIVMAWGATIPASMAAGAIVTLLLLALRHSLP